MDEIIKTRGMSMTREEIQEEYHKCCESFDYWKEHYFMRPRTMADWQEIVYAIRDEFNQNLVVALETYKQDRQKWVDWYNKKLMGDKI